MPNEHRADPTPPPHHGQGRGGSKKESSSLRVSPALHPPERPSPRRADIADHGLGRETNDQLFLESILGIISRSKRSVPTHITVRLSLDIEPFDPARQTPSLLPLLGGT